MSKYTYNFGSIYLVVEAEQLAEDVWLAWTQFNGGRIEARSGSKREAITALIVAMKSEIVSHPQSQAGSNLLLGELDLPGVTLSALHEHGMLSLDDMRPLTNRQILQIPNIGGQGYRMLLQALGRSRKSRSPSAR